MPFPNIIKGFYHFRAFCNISQKSQRQHKQKAQIQYPAFEGVALSSPNGFGSLLASSGSGTTPRPADFTPVNQTLYSSLQELSEKIMQVLNMNNFCVVDNLLDNSLVLQIYNEVRSLCDNSSAFQPGQLISNPHPRNGSITNIRGDYVAWIDFATSPNMLHLSSGVRFIDKIIAFMSMSPLLAGCNIRSRSSIMLACYPGGGTHYKRHVDNPSRDGRKITAILYLNKDYVATRDGGQLRIHRPDGSCYYDIEPFFGRVAIFWSDSRTPHEVLPSFKERLAISIWYLDTKERSEALKSGSLPVN